MSFHQRNIAVSTVSFTLILGFFLIRVIQMLQGGSFLSTNVFRLWGITIVLAIVATIVLTILAHIGSGILQAMETGQEPKMEDVEDERDRLIDLRGTRVTYVVSSFGAALSMLTFVLGQPPLVMFSLLIFSGLLAQIVGDISRLALYRRGF